MNLSNWLCRAAAVGALAAPSFAHADCTPLPNNLTNGQTADATQVMNNFNGILSCGRFTGNVAIGGSPPGDVGMNGGLVINGSSSTQLEVQQNGTSAFALNAGNFGAGSWTLWDHANGNWIASISSSHGFVGIGGAPSTGYAVDVYGIGRFVSPNVGSTGAVIIRDASGDPGAAFLQFVNNENNSQYAAIQAWSGGLVLNPGGGNVGVTTGSSGALLALGPAVTTIKLALYDNGASNLFGIGVNPGELTFGAGIAASGTPQMVLTATGNVGIGVTSPAVAIDVAGAGHATLGWSTTSDEGLKKNVGEIHNALGLVERLEGVRFEWRAPSERDVGRALSLPQGPGQLGLVAQQVDAVVPEVVTKPATPDGVYSVRYDGLVPVLIEAVKEQQAEIQELKSEVAALKRTSLAALR